jgi:CBS domain-containing protein
MFKEVNTVDEEITVTEAAKVMTADKTFDGYVLIFTGGKPTGIITERDIVNQVIAKARDPSVTPVSEIMSMPLITIDPDADLLTASRVMHEHNVDKLVVVRNEILYGILTERIIAHHFGDYVDRSIRDIIRWTALMTG